MYYTQRLYDFLNSLHDNNDKRWFEAHRVEYNELRQAWIEDVGRMLDKMRMWDPAFDLLDARECVYRINRNLRFSRDKTPYKTYFAANIKRGGRRSGYAGYYLDFGVGEDFECGLYGGLWSMEPEVLRKLRHAIDDNIEEWEEIVNAQDLQRNFPGWCSDMLKTMPKGWDRNSPNAFYLRMTNYGKWHPVDLKFYSDPSWPDHAARLFHSLKPFVDFLNYSIDE